MKFVEEVTGVGDLVRRGELLRRVPYKISRYQGVLEGSGMPVPGLHRVEGTLDLAGAEPLPCLVGEPLMLRLEDGRSLAITLADETGRVLSEGHGPGRGCSCC